MRLPAAVVALPLLAGCSAGILHAEVISLDLPLCAAGGAALALIAGACFFSDGFAEGVTAAVALGCALSGLSLGLVAARTAYRPHLLILFDTLDPSVRDAPVELEGMLREDGSPGSGGVSLSLEVKALVRGVDQRRTRTSGGIRVNVAGVAAVDRLKDWRAGRHIRAQVLLRLPSSYRDPGLPDEIKELARRGVVLLGTVKSASLVDVVAPGSICTLGKSLASGTGSRTNAGLGVDPRPACVRSLEPEVTRRSRASWSRSSMAGRAG